MDEAVDQGSLSTVPQPSLTGMEERSPDWALLPNGIVPSLVRQVKGSEGHLRQHKTCDVSNAGTDASSSNGRSADDQCRHRGREAVVAGGVTTTQGHG